MYGRPTALQEQVIHLITVDATVNNHRFGVSRGVILNVRLASSGPSALRVLCEQGIRVCCTFVNDNSWLCVCVLCLCSVFSVCVCVCVYLCFCICVYVCRYVQCVCTCKLCIYLCVCAHAAPSGTFAPVACLLQMEL